MSFLLENERLILKKISTNANVAEGPESIREVLLNIYREKQIKNKTLSQLTQIPIPTLSAIRGELIKEGILESITSFTYDGLRLVEENRGFRYSPCPLDESFLDDFSIEDYPESILSQEAISNLKLYLMDRPSSDVQLDQSMATFETQMKRLNLLLMNGDLEGRSVLLLGDDDATSVLLSATGLAKRIVVVDIDKRILDFVSNLKPELQKTKIETYQYDLRNTLGKEFGQNFDIIFTDPPYTLQGVRLFFERGRYGLWSEGTKFYLSIGPKQPYTLWNIQLQLINMGFILWKNYPAFNKYKGNLRLGQFSNLFIFKMVHSPELLVPMTSQPFKDKIYTADVKPLEKNLPQNPIEFEKPERSIGYHIIAELYGLKTDIVFQPNELYKKTLQLCNEVQLRVIDSYLYLYPPQGLSIIVTLAESHIGIHTWPEHDYLSLDVFICDDPQKAHSFVSSMKDIIKPEKTEEIVINRGLEAN